MNPLAALGSLVAAGIPTVLLVPILAVASGSAPTTPQTPGLIATTGVPAGGNASGDDSGTGADSGNAPSGGGSTSGPCGPWDPGLTGVTVTEDEVGFYPTAASAVAASPLGSATLYTRQCQDESGVWYEEQWFPDGGESSPPPPSVDDLWPGAYDEARRRIPLPVLEIAPPVIQGTLVNAPLWLAVDPPAPVSARAQVGAVWAQVDASFTGLTWDMGVPGTDDDVVECDGPGEPWDGISATEDPWQVPECGWNYEQPSTPEHTGNGGYWYDITVTAHWEVRLTGSDGRDEPLDPIDVALEFDYVVWELQTVGSS